MLSGPAPKRWSHLIDIVYFIIQDVSTLLVDTFEVTTARTTQNRDNLVM